MQPPPRRSLLRYLKEKIKSWLFGSLIRLLERFVQTNDLPPHPTSAQQRAIIEKASPLVQKWISNPIQFWLLRALLPFLLQYPEGSELYHRNAVFTGKRFGIFAHVWAPGKATPVHNHDGTCALTIPLTGGMREAGYELAKLPDGRWDGRIVRLVFTGEHMTPAGIVDTLIRGPGSIHEVKNGSLKPGIMIEIYFWRERPFSAVNHMVPVEGKGKEEEDGSSAAVSALLNSLSRSRTACEKVRSGFYRYTLKNSI